MSRKVLFVLLATLGCVAALFSEAPLKLQFSTGTPVEMVTTQTYTINQVIPAFNLKVEGTQTITSLLTLRGLNSPKQQTKPPFSLDWTLKVIQLNFSANDHTIAFDSRQPQNSLLSKELAKWVDHPIQLTIDPSLSLERNSEELDKFIKKFPAIQELDPYTFLEGVILPIFGIADQEIIKGGSISRTNLRGDFGIALSVLKYEITEITDRLVTARFQGTIEPKDLPLKNIFGNGKEGSELLQVNVAGTVEGTISWDKSNALLCRLSGDCDYRCKIKIAGLEVPLTAKLKTTLQTMPASILVQSKP
ncbi:MAG: hypothetical protein H0U49_02220 [Parachlamydiaceae bacterium]|nr:hypothetical protein [Parachlamydiaceae bacterium]